MIKGISFSLIASCLFGFLYYYPVLLKPLSTIEIFCWRLLMSTPAVALLITIDKRWPAVIALGKRVQQKPKLALALFASAAILSVQMLIFIWAPLNGKALSVSLGYFILPLAMVICGRFIYKERFSLLQKIAVFLAVLGVILEIYITGAFSLETVIIVVGYPVYFIFRRELNIDGIAGTFSDFFLIACGCLLYMLCSFDLSHITNHFIQFYFYIPMLGIITAVAFAAYFASSRLLPLGLFGLLGYIEPILLTIVSLTLLHETISDAHLVPYLLIWGAVFFLIIEGGLYAIRIMRQRKIKAGSIVK